MTLLPKSPGLKLENVAIDAETISLSVASSGDGREDVTFRVNRRELQGQVKPNIYSAL